METSLLSQSPPVTSDEMEHLTAQLSATHELCQQLLARQERFEKSVNKRLSEIQESLGDLVLSPGPFPKLLPTLDTPRQHKSQAPLPTPSVVLITSTPSPSPTASIAQPEETSEGKVGLAYSRVSAIRSNSCSLENFASNLVNSLGG